MGALHALVRASEAESHRATTSHAANVRNEGIARAVSSCVWMATQAIYYRDREGAEPVRDYRASLADGPRAALDHHVMLLNHKPDNAPPPDFPATSQVRGQLRELRVRTLGRQHRILYRRSDNLLVLLHAFAKNTGALDEGDIALAERRFDDFSTRMNESSRSGPRAAGHDAP